MISLLSAWSLGIFEMRKLDNAKVDGVTGRLYTVDLDKIKTAEDWLAVAKAANIKIFIYDTAENFDDVKHLLEDENESTT